MPPRPRVTPAQLAMYAGAMCTQQEVADILGVTQQAISNLLQKPAYREAWENAKSHTRYHLRRAQIDKALDGDKTMLIWTGKQYLEQRDAPKEIEMKSDVQVTYIARWGSQGGELPAPADEKDVLLIEGEAEEEDE